MPSRESTYTREASGKQVRQRMIRQLAAKQIKLCLAGEEHFQQYSAEAEKAIERAGGETLVMISNGRSIYAAKTRCNWCGCDIPRLSKKSARAQSTKMCPVCSSIYNNFGTLKCRTQQALVQKLEGQSVVKETTEANARFIMRDARERRSRGEDAWIDAFRHGNRWFVGDLRNVLQWAIKHLSKRAFKDLAGEKFVDYLMYYDKMRLKGRNIPRGTNEWIDLMHDDSMETNELDDSMDANELVDQVYHDLMHHDNVRVEGYKIPKGAYEWSSLYAYLPDDF